MGHQDGGLVAEQAAHAVLKDVLGGVVVHSREGVVLQGAEGAGVGRLGSARSAAWNALLA